MAWYISPTTSVAHILWMLLVIFGTVAFFDVLMQNLYKVMQGNNEKVLSFSMRLEGTLNQIRLQYPKRMMDLEVQQCLKDCLFHGVQEHIHDSIWYLYSTPGAFYFQQLVAAHKVENKNKEGMVELGQQIAKLMAALTKVGQGNNPSSVPSSPLERGQRRGCSGSNTSSHPNSHNGRVGPGQTTPAHSLPTGCKTGAMELGVMDRATKGLEQGGRAQPTGGTKFSPML